jgi:hypothetical protein
MRAQLIRRVEKLKAASAGGAEVTWEEMVLWSYRDPSECCLDNPEYADFAKRYNGSRISRLMEPFTRPHAKPAGEA